MNVVIAPNAMVGEWRNCFESRSVVVSMYGRPEWVGCDGGGRCVWLGEKGGEGEG